MKICSVLMVLLLILGLTACGGPAPAEEDGTQAQTQVLQLTAGQTLTLNAGEEDAVWLSSDPERVQVAENGTVTALKDRGTVTVTAAWGDRERSWEITLCQQTDYGPVSLPSAEEKLTVGVWNGSYHDIDEAHMKLIADSGISLLIGLQDRYVTNNTIGEILDYAQKYGVSVMTDLRDWDKQSVPEFAEHPALAGFLMFDEPAVMQFGELAELKEAFDQVMPDGKLFFVNLLPMAYSNDTCFGNAYAMEIELYEDTYTKQFVDMLDVPYISVDIYSLMENGMIRPGYFGNIESVAQLAKTSEREFWLTVLTAPHGVSDGRYMTPGAQELRWQMAVAMTYGARNLVHYVLCSHDTENYDTMIEYGTFAPTDIYDAVCTANKEILAWDDIFTSFTWKGVSVVDAGDPNTMLERLSYAVPLSGAVTEIESDQDLLVGIFDNAGQSAYMITNAGSAEQQSAGSQYASFTMENASVRLSVEGEYCCAAVISQGQITYVPVTDGVVDLAVEAYEGVFVIPIMK